MLNFHKKKFKKMNDITSSIDISDYILVKYISNKNSKFAAWTKATDKEK